nr:MAG TPA: hypothetical protein [Caudoviricetes sp.]
MRTIRISLSLVKYFYDLPHQTIKISPIIR